MRLALALIFCALNAAAQTLPEQSTPATAENEEYLTQQVKKIVTGGNFPNGITFPDGTVQTSASVAASATLFASSASMNFISGAPTFTNTTAATATIISSLTFTASGNFKICAGGSGVLASSINAGEVGWGLMVNGQYPPDGSFSNTKSPLKATMGAVNNSMTVPVIWRSTGTQGAGPVTFRLAPFLIGGGGTGTVDPNSARESSNWWAGECP